MSERIIDMQVQDQVNKNHSRLAHRLPPPPLTRPRQDDQQRLSLWKPHYLSPTQLIWYLNGSWLKAGTHRHVGNIDWNGK